MISIRIRRGLTIFLCSLSLGAGLLAAPALPQPAGNDVAAPPAAPPPPVRDAAVPPGNEVVAPSAAPADSKPQPPHYQDAIVAIVNDKPISEYDLQQRMALVMSTSNLPDTQQMRDKVREEVLNQLETEMIQRQEALKNQITVSSVEVDKDIQGILTDNHMTMDQLKGVLARGHVVMATLRAQIAAQLLWEKTVEQEYAGRVNITPEQVNAEMARIAEGANKTHFTVSEIFLAVDNPEQDEKALKDAQNLETQLQAGAPFASVARQFSQSPSAADGGDIGMVYDGQLAPELNVVLEGMKTGDISQPVRAPGGYFILQLRQRLEAVGTKIPEAPKPEDTALPDSLPLTRILLPIPPKTPQQILDNVLKVSEAIREHISSCDMIPKLMTQVKGAAVFPMGMTKLDELNQQTRDALAKTTAGDVAAPFQDAAGIEIFARCDKAPPKIVGYQLPTREEVENELFKDQISALARRYNRDLRRDADIETR
jgi:peptidyl-prolyl cis-trans isomerase SurA